MLPAVTNIMQTMEYAEFADRVLASYDRAYILDISPAAGEMLAKMQACWKACVALQHAGIQT